MDNYVPVDAPKIDGVPLLLATQEARKADPELDSLLSQIARENTPLHQSDAREVLSESRT